MEPRINQLFVGRRLSTLPSYSPIEQGAEWEDGGKEEQTRTHDVRPCLEIERTEEVENLKALAPAGEFRKAPLNYIRFGIGARIAKTLIEAIKCGKSLPADVVEQLSIVKL